MECSNPISSFLRVNETPNIVLEVREREVCGDLENALAYKQVKPLITVPNYTPLQKGVDAKCNRPKRISLFPASSINSKLTK